MSVLLHYPDDAPPSTAPLSRLLPPDATTRRRSAITGLILASVLAIVYFTMLMQFWAPAHSGIDQNGYLVGGRQLAMTGSTGLALPEGSTGFVGGMWVRVAETGINYPKYPNGLPLLYACFLWALGAAAGGAGVTWAFLVSPIGAAAAVLGTYHLSRQYAGPFASVLAMVLMGFSQVTLVLANNPNSHAICLAFCVWGVYLLLRFWQSGTIWSGALAGFLLGYAVTIRYTEGLLGILIGVVVLSMIRWRDWHSYLRASVPVIGWIIPVGYLVGFNLVAMGTPTGYDTTNESIPGAAFTLEHIGQNWEKLVRQVHDGGLFFVVPLGLLGMILATATSLRRSSMLWLWLVPGTITYMAYYWAPDRGVSYLRFFLTLFPPLIVGAAVTFEHLLKMAAPGIRRLVMPIACGLIVACASGMGLYRAVSGMEEGQFRSSSLESQQRSAANLYALGQVVAEKVPEGSILFAGQNELHYLQFVGNYQCYDPEYFTTSFVKRQQQQGERLEETDPNPRQPERRRYLVNLLGDKSEAELVELQNDILTRALAADQRAFVVMPKSQADSFVRRYVRKNKKLTSQLIAVQNDHPRVRAAAEGESSRSTTPGRPTRGGGTGGGFFGDRGPQKWHILEITASKSPPAPTPAPATQPVQTAVSDR